MRPSICLLALRKGISDFDINHAIAKRNDRNHAGLKFSVTPARSTDGSMSVATAIVLSIGMIFVQTPSLVLDTDPFQGQ